MLQNGGKHRGAVLQTGFEFRRAMSVISFEGVLFMSESIEEMAPVPAKRPRKSEVIHVRVTTGERAALDAAAGQCGERLSSFLRIAGLYQASAPGQVDVEAAEMRSAVKGLAGATNNLNQLAKAANRGRISMSETDRLMLLELRDTIRQTREALDLYTKAADSRAGRLPAAKSRRVTQSEPVS